MAITSSSRFTLKEGVESAISKYLEDYSAEVIQAMEKTVTEVAKDSVKKLKADSPKGATGNYAKGWTYTLDQGRLRAGATIHGKKGTYNLAHLLEFGHAIVGGGRSKDRTKAITHIEPVEQWAIEEFQRRLVRELEG
jgi:hypothetical protein